MERLELRLLGAPAVLEADRRIAIPTRKAMVLLARLATSRGFAVSRADAVAFLWPDVTADRGRASLRQTLARLRQALPPEVIHADAHTIELPPQRWWIDVHDLDTALGGPWMVGEFLAGEYFGEPHVDRWLDEERRHWREAALARLRAKRDENRAQPKRLIDLSHAILALDPYDEQTHRDLMGALAALGHTGRAISQYDTLAALTESELGIAPQEETRALVREIRLGRHSRGPTSAPPSSTEPAEVEDFKTMRLVTVVSLAGAHLPAAAQSALRAVAERQHGAMWMGEPTRLVLGLEDAAEGDVVDALASLLPYRESASIGCASGLALIGEDERTGAAPPTGAVVAQADMLALLAQKSEILLSDTLRRQLGEAVDASEIDVRGRSVFLFQGLTTASIRAAPPFVGRSAELAQTAALVDDLRRGRGGVLVVTGVPGIGKTRLIEETLKDAGPGAFLRAQTGFQAFGDGATAFRVRLAGALRGCLAASFAVEDLPLHLRRTARAMFDPASATGARREGVEDERQIRDVIVAMIDTVTKVEPLVVQIDDTHWAISAQIAFLTALFEATSRHPVLYVVSERPAQDKLAAAVRGRSIDHTGLVLSLAPLGPHDARALAAATAPARSDVSGVVEKAQGNPLFLTHLAASARQEDALPVNLIALVQEQLDHHPREVAAACHRAAILGHRFPNAAFAAVFPETPLAHLIRSGFITMGETETMFTHALIQDAIYAMIPPERRPALHRRAAETFRSQNPVLWAEHALRAGRDPDAAR
ncbi:MAG: AAA family ATPase, partial [Pseudomonadota bacterium]